MSSKTELLEILSNHVKKYPLIQNEDIVKLIYQNELGGGHLIADLDKSLSFIKSEYHSIEHKTQSQFLEPIGNNIVRVNLHRIDTSVLSLENLNMCFAESAKVHTGSLDALKDKLVYIEENFSLFKTALNKKVFAEFIKDYMRQGCPMLHHSTVYRDKYSPAYRVVDTKVLKSFINIENRQLYEEFYK